MELRNTLKKVVVVSLMSLVHTAYAAVNDLQMPENLSRLFPQSAVVSIKKHEGTGLLKVELRGGAKYLITSDGGYIIKGSILKVEGGQIVDEESIEAQKTIGEHASDLYITYKSTAEKEIGHVYVVGDATCVYCALFHKGVRKINAAGISVSYIPYPIAGVASEPGNINRHVWCAKDKQGALSYAFAHHGELSPSMELANTCRDNIIEEGHKLGRTLNIKGTPTLIFSNGGVVPGNIASDVVISRFK